jgi:flagellar biosynthetic protein FliP
MIRILAILFSLVCGVAIAAPADSSIPVFGNPSAKGITLSTPTQIVILMTLLTLLPAVVMAVSPFLRITIVLHFLRQALGTQSAPSNQVLVGLALFLAFLVMQPVVTDIYHRGWEPVENGTLSWEQGFDEGAKPLKTFLVKFAREKDIQTCVEIAKSPAPRSAADLDL